jgi:hypothetical protein
MSKDWRIILRFAAVGLAISVVFFAFLRTDTLRESSIAHGAMWAGSILCPGFLPFLWAAAAELQLPGFALMWLIVGLINFVLYGLIGAAYVGLRKKREGVAAS